MTVYGCGRDEAAMFREVAPRFGVSLTIADAAVCEANADLARGQRCVGIGHKTHVTNATLLALSQVGSTCRRQDAAAGGGASLVRQIVRSEAMSNGCRGRLP